LSSLNLAKKTHIASVSEHSPLSDSHRRPVEGANKVEPGTATMAARRRRLLVIDDDEAFAYAQPATFNSAASRRSWFQARWQYYGFCCWLPTLGGENRSRIR